MTSAIHELFPLNRLVVRRRTVLDAALLLIVAGSQLGMLWLAGVYLEEGRSSVQLSPEALVGVLAIAVAVATVPLFPDHSWRLRLDLTGWLLIAFLAVACVNEVVRYDARLRNLPTFLSIGAYYLIGRSVGMAAVNSGVGLPARRGLLLIYTAWYLWMCWFLLRGGLGFYGLLPGTGIPRLQFREGFTATEIPILVGFQLPILLYVVLADRSLVSRVWAGAIAFFGILVIAASISAGAIVATLLSTFIVVCSHGLRRGSKWLLGAALPVAVFVAVLAGVGQLLSSIHDKLDEIVRGEGERGRIYAQLVADILREPLAGIGRGRFVENYQLGWLGEGVYPHNNLLGIGAELGLPALLLFAAFSLSACGVLAYGAFGSATRTDRDVRLVAAVALAIFLYQQARGLLQDTWDAHETYVWLGVGVGAVLAFEGRGRAERERLAGCGRMSSNARGP